jgi:hypothetical protein
MCAKSLGIAKLKKKTHQKKTNYMLHTTISMSAFFIIALTLHSTNILQGVPSVVNEQN